MIKDVDPIPNPQAPLTPYLTVKDVEEAIAFYKKAFDAEVTYTMKNPLDEVVFAEMRIGMAHIMLGTESPETHFYQPQGNQKKSVAMYLYVKDVDAFVEKAVAAGLKTEMPLKDQFYGDRMGEFVDPFGHVWMLSQQKQILSADEMQRRASTKL